VFQRILTKARSVWASPNSRAVIIITVFTFASRGMGMLRQALMVTRFDSVTSDLLLAANKIPENIAQLLIMGTIITSVLPVASRIESKDVDSDKDPLENTSKYLYICLVSILVVVGSINLIALIFTPQILSLPFVTSSETIKNFTDRGILEDYYMTTRILLIGPLLFATQSIFNVFLFLKKRFMVYSWAGMIYNIATVIGILLARDRGYIIAAWSMVVGAFATIVLYWWDSKKSGLRDFSVVFKGGLRYNFAQFKKDLYQTWKLFLPRIFILDAVVLANLLITPIAQPITQKPGQITAVDISLSIYSAFFIVITSLGTVFFPDLAKIFNEKPRTEFWKILRKYTKNALFLSIGVSILTVIGAPAVVWFFGVLGKFKVNKDYIVFLAQIASVGIVFRAIKEIWSKYFFVRERVWQPVIIEGVGIIAQIAGTYILYIMNVDAGINVMINMTLHLVIWVVLAFGFVYRDWRRGV
jgi:peptidoglycan biosynthesis protein MviN/MurJ (putative lipid II flippase)